jgi:hypothetical protein
MSENLQSANNDAVNALKSLDGVKKNFSKILGPDIRQVLKAQDEAIRHLAMAIKRIASNQ